MNIFLNDIRITALPNKAGKVVVKINHVKYVIAGNNTFDAIDEALQHFMINENGLMSRSR